MVVIDTVVRYVPGVLGDADSVTEESHSDPGRLEYPQYTRPRVFRDMAVPAVLVSGDHQAVARWRHEQSEARSQRHPDLASESDSSEKKKEGNHEKQTTRAGRGRRASKKKLRNFTSAIRSTFTSGFWKARRNAFRSSAAW